MPSLDLVWSNIHIVAAAAGALVIGAAFFLLSRSKSASAKSDLIRAVVGKSSDFKEGEPRAVKIEGAKNQILVVRHSGQLHAVGSKCPHAGASLNTGVFSCGRIVCPLHGASFDVTTGEIEDAGPCLNQLPTFEVTLEGDNVIVSGSASVIDSKLGSVPAMCSHTSSDTRTFVIIGAGAAGAAAAEALRQANFTGRIILLSRERHLPYDRLQCSKDLSKTMESMLLRSKEFYRRIDVEVRLGVSGSEIDIQRKELKLSDASTLSFDKALIATGSDARQVVDPGALDNAFVLRTYDDMERLRARISGAKNFVIVGSSFIGLEACSMIRKHFDDAKVEGQGSSQVLITVIGMEKVPLERVLGAEIGASLQALHQENGVRFLMETSLQPSDYVTQGGIITAIKTKNETLPADIVIVGAGAIPSLQKDGSAGFWSSTVPPVAPPGTLRVNGHPLLGNNGIAVDQHMHVANGVYAAGDIAEMPFKGDRIRVEHWGMAEQQGRVAAFHMAGRTDRRAVLDAIPFFWTKQYGTSVRYVGYCSKPDRILVDGDLKTRNKCSVFYIQGASVRAVATIGADPAAAAAAELLRLDKMPTAEAIEKRIHSKQPAGLALPEILKVCGSKNYNPTSPWN